MKDRIANRLRIIRDQARMLHWQVKKSSRVLYDTEGLPVPRVICCSWLRVASTGAGI